MARGFLAGVIWGTVVAGIGAGTLSQLSERPPSDLAPDPAASRAQPELAAAPQQDPETPGRLPSPERAVDLPEAEPEAPADPPEPDASEVDTEPAKAPEVGDAPKAPDGAEAGIDGAGIEIAEEAPLPTVGEVRAPDAPTPEEQPDISADPGQPPRPALADGDSAGAADPTPDAVDPVTDDAGSPAPEPESAAEPAPAAEPEPEPEPEVRIRPDARAPEEAPTEDEIRIGRPAGSLLDRTPAVPEGRLPRVGQAESTEGAAVSRLAPDSPLLRFAAPVEVAADVPRMSIVLIDDGSQVMGPDAFDSFPFPVSFAIAPDHPAPADAAAAYRQLGFEVLAMVSLPAGAQPSDVEVTLSGTMAQIREAVAVIEDPTGGLQDSKDVSDQAVSILSDTGHGLVMMPKGLNTAQKLALKAGVPSVSVFRDLDGENQGAEVIRRTLDQAAFRARQEGAVVMLGRLRPDTVSSLILWGLQDRSGSIALVPVSTVLIESLAE